MRTYDRLAEVPLAVEDLTLERQERETSSGFTRVSTVVALHGPDGRTGRGEDVTYDTPDHDAFFVWVTDGDGGGRLTDALAGSHTVDTFADAVADADLFPAPPERETARPYRRWAFESAALDLALRQAGLSLGDVLERSYDPLTFVASARLGEPPTADRVHALREGVPDLGFKLDPTPDWDDALVAELREAGAVRIADLKGLYEGTDVDVEPDPALYRRVVEGLPDAIVEDPALTPETEPIVREAADRLSWDYPITDRGSVVARREGPGIPYCNVKPSRFGSFASLFDTLDYCLANGITLYGGGQFELDVGRGQIQALASLFHPDGPNDVAPRVYNDPDPPDDPPAPPLDPGDGPAVGFGFREQDWQAG